MQKAGDTWQLPGREAGSEEEKRMMPCEPGVKQAKQDERRQSVSSCMEYGEQGGRMRCQEYQGKQPQDVGQCPEQREERGKEFREQRAQDEHL